MKMREFLALLIYLWLVPFACAQTEHQGSYLLLTNGQVIEGDVVREKDKFWVTKTSGSHLAFPVNNVASVSKTLSEVYWSKYSLLSASDSQGHISLMRWCLDKNLLNEAGNQMDILQFLDASPTQLLQLNEELLDRISAKKNTITTSDGPRTSSSPVAPNEIATNKDRSVRPVNYEAAITQREQAAFERAEFEDLLTSTSKSLPGHSVVMFKRKIEPLLIHSCYTAKCHDGNSSSFNLRALGKSSSIPKRMSQENLLQVLQLTDASQPLESRLLAAAAMPHAGSKNPILQVESTQFQLLRTWLISISASPFQFHPLPAAFLQADLAVKTNRTQTTTSNLTEPGKALETSDFGPIPKSLRAGKDVVDEHAAEPKHDPFDPEVFNRKYRSDKSSADHSK